MYIHVFCRINEETTLNQIKHHLKESTFVVTHLIPNTLEKLERNSVVILIGTAGIGKSRNSLEVLRRYCADHEGYYAISFPKLSEWSGLINADDKVVVWIDDVFGRTNSTFMDEDTKWLDIISATLSNGYVKLILTMRNSIKSLLSDVTDCHEIFRQTHFIDLSSESLQMNKKEKEQCLLNHCQKNNILKSDFCSENQRFNDNNFLDPSVAVYIDWKTVYDIVNVDVCPLLGFPQSCHLFASNRKFTRQGVAFFKHPTQALCDEINNLRSVGRHDDSNALEYAVLVYILLNGDILEFGRISCVKIEQILRSIYGVSNIKYTSTKIKDTGMRLIGRYLKIKGDNSICFQHRNIFESVLLSYRDIDPDLMILYLDLEALLELGCLENYTPQPGEVTFIFYSEHYKVLADQLVRHLKSASSPNCFIKKLCASKILRHGNARFLEDFYNAYMSSKLDIHIRMQLLCSSQTEINYWNRQAVDVHNPEVKFTFLESILSHSSDFKDNTNVVIDLLNLIYKNLEFHNAVYVKERYTHCLTLCALHACTFQDSKRLDALSEFIIKNRINLDKDVMADFFARKENNEASILKTLVLNLKDPDWMDIELILDKVVAMDNVEVLHFILNFYDYKPMNLQKALKTACQKGSVNVFEWFCTQNYTETGNVNSLLLTSCEYGKAAIVSSLLCKFNHDFFSFEEALTKALNNVNIESPLFLWKNCYFNIVYILLTQTNHSFNVIDIMNMVLHHSINRSSRNFDMEDCCKLVRYLIQTFDISKFDLNSVVELAGLCSDSSILEFLLQKIDTSNFYAVWVKTKHFRYHRDLVLQHIIRTNQLIIKDVQTLLDVEIKAENDDNIKVLLETFDWGSLNIKSVIHFGCSRKPKLVLWIFEKFGLGSFQISEILEIALERRSWDILKWLLKNVDHHPFDLNTIVKSVSQYRSPGAFNWIFDNFDHKLFDLQSLMGSACQANNIEIVKAMINMFGVLKFDLEEIMKFALRNHCTEIVKNVLTKDNYSGNFNMLLILNTVCYSNEIELVKWLLQRFTSLHFNFHRSIKETLKVARNSKHTTRFDTLKYLLSNCDAIFLDVATITQDLCNIGAFDMIEWILDKFDRSIFDLNFIMDKACEYGSLHFVQLMFDKCKNKIFNLASAFKSACKPESSDVLAWLLRNFDNTQFDLKHVHTFSFRNIMFLIENCEHSLLDFNNILKYLSKKLDKDIYVELVWCLIEVVDCKHFDIKLIFNQICRNGTVHFVNWVMNKFDHKLLDFESAVLEALHNLDVEVVIFILKSKAKEQNELDVSSIFIQACHHSRTQVVDWLLYNFDIRRFNVCQAIDILCSSMLCNEEVIFRILRKADVDLLDFNSILKSACRGYTSISFKKWLINASDRATIDPQSIIREVCTRTNPDWEFVELLLTIFDSNLFDTKLILERACKTGSSAFVQWLLNFDNGAFDLKSAFHIACLANNLDVMRWFIEAYDIAHFDLHSAISTILTNNNKIGAVIEYLFTIICPSKYELQLAIDKCCDNYDSKRLKWLLNTFNCSQVDPNSSIDKLFEKQYLDESAMKLILENFEHNRLDIETLVVRVCERQLNNRFVLWLLKTIEHSSLNLPKIIFEICLMDDVAIMTYLIVTCQYEYLVDGDLILKIIKTGKPDVIIWLLRNFKDVKFDLDVAMNNACISGNTRIVQWLLLKHGAKRFDLISAMNSVCCHGNLDTAQYLLQIMHYEAFDMQSAMNQACKHGHIGLAKWFLAVYDIELFNMQTAILSAFQNGNQELAEWFREKLNID